MTTCFHQGGLGHAARTTKCQIFEPFHESFDCFPFLLLCAQKGRHINFSIIFEEASQEESLKVRPFVDGSGWQFHEPLKGNASEGTNEQPRHDASFSTIFPV